MSRFVLLLLFAAAMPAAAEPVVTVRENGPAANRVDIVILGDGYTARELLKFAADVDRLIGPMFTRSPYAEYASYFNVRRVDVASTQSGVDHPERGIARDTALGATYFCGGFLELICVDHGAVNAVLSRSVAPDERDVVIVLVNDLMFGGGGGAITTASTDIGVANLVLHELGHSIGLLGDEYVLRQCNTPEGRERPEPNITRETARHAVKWAAWIDAGTPLPTDDPSPGIVGLYPGAANCPHLHRPTYDSMMRSIGKPFEAVNTEQLIKRFYNYVSPIDDAVPADVDVVSTGVERLEFLIEPVHPVDHDLEIRWTIDGRSSGADAVLLVETQQLDAGAHTIEVEVRDLTPAVRHDPQRALVELRRWNLLIRR